MSSGKPRVIKDYDKLSEEIQQQIKLIYPYGYSQNLITFTDKDGKLVSALPFETDEKYYLVRMTKKEANFIIQEDDDFDDDGNLKSDSKLEFEDKFSDLDYMPDAEDTSVDDDIDDDNLDKDEDDDDDDDEK